LGVCKEEEMEISCSIIMGYWWLREISKGDRGRVGSGEEGRREEGGKIIFTFLGSENGSFWGGLSGDIFWG
jgi:hypothetical protein